MKIRKITDSEQKIQKRTEVSQEALTSSLIQEWFKCDLSVSQEVLTSKWFFEVPFREIWEIRENRDVREILEIREAREILEIREIWEIREIRDESKVKI